MLYRTVDGYHLIKFISQFPISYVAKFQLLQHQNPLSKKTRTQKLTMKEKMSELGQVVFSLDFDDMQLHACIEIDGEKGTLS